MSSNVWKTRNKDIDLSDSSIIMGILNSTPDSFSDGGQFYSLEKAVSHSLEMIEHGATIIDIGGESTRPGSKPVSLDEEIKRTVPLIKALRQKSDVAISIDTTKSEVARQALLAGANIINDVSGLKQDPKMLTVAVDLKAGCCVMHMRGTAQTMQDFCHYSNVSQEVLSELITQVNFLKSNGLNDHQIVIDPGIGFSKTPEQNIEIMQKLENFTNSPYPVLLGTSRKSFIGHILDEKDASQRLWGTAGSIAVGLQKGCKIFRVHDVKEMAQVIKVMERCS